MAGSGGEPRRLKGRPRRSTYVAPRALDARAYRRKSRKGWANWL